MNSMVYLISRFTPEALLFEALIILVLACGYTAFWVLKKRRLGAIENQVPATVVKDYLNEIIVDAEQLRNQLFGLLSAAGLSVGRPAVVGAPVIARSLTASETTSIDPMALDKISALEAKIGEQTRMIEVFMAEKSKIEKELAEARAAGASASRQGENSPAVVQLKEKVQTLEAKLAEYSVIEDDLANLKRLDQENKQLKAALGGKSPAAAQTAAPISMPEAAPALAEAIASPSADSGFEGLVDQVEQSLQQPPSVASTETPASPSAEIPGGEKSDADLVAEFEKMLNG